MSLASTMSWVKAHRWWVALMAVVVLGYSVGKDRALRENRAAAAQTAEAR